MKKGFLKTCGVMLLSTVMAVSNISYASAAEVEMNGTIELNDNNTASYTEDYEKDNGVESYLIIREKTETEVTARKVSLEQLKTEVANGQAPEMAAVVFQVADSWRAEAYHSQQAGIENNQGEIEIGAGQTYVENSGDTIVALNQEQKSLVYEIASIVPQTIVLTDDCILDNEYLFADCGEIKAVDRVESDGISILDKVRDYDLEKEHAEYLQLLAIGNTSLHGTSTNGTESESDTTGSTNRAAGTLNGANSPTDDTETNSQTSTKSETTAQKNITITLVADELLEEEDYLTATYQITSEKEITYCRVKLTYDKDVMTYDVVEEADALMDMTCKVVESPADNNGQEGSVTFEFLSTTPKKVNGDMLDAYFDLKEPAKEGQEYILTLTVEEIKNGSTSIKDEVEVVQQNIVAANDPELDAQTETQETTAETTYETEIQTETQAPAATVPTNAPKTDDTTNIFVFLLAMACSATVFYKISKTRKKA